ncbi:hypothetical protein L1274_002081 [Duganella sp. HSC-15S17]|uniref:Uncharacterized protein n=1 Tax=Duganella violaceipulchra TaxID=2849652 RepID=A0ABT1GHE0_9BURK|nr:hypothetical protein [Duganella violaceicalia]
MNLLPGVTALPAAFDNDRQSRCLLCLNRQINGKDVDLT